MSLTSGSNTSLVNLEGATYSTWISHQRCSPAPRRRSSGAALAAVLASFTVGGIRSPLTLSEDKDSSSADAVSRAKVMHTGHRGDQRPPNSYESLGLDVCRPDHLPHFSV